MNSELHRQVSRRALNKLHPGNRLRLMFGHEVDKSDPGYPEFKKIMDDYYERSKNESLRSLPKTLE